MSKDEKLTPYWTRKTGPDGMPILEVKLPSCVFNDVRADGKPPAISIAARCASGPLIRIIEMAAGGRPLDSAKIVSEATSRS